MKDCDCYSFKLINRTDDPILKNVDLAIVLTMENSTRKFDDSVLLNLAPLTYVQINKGFKKCNKPSVNSVVADVIHAHKNVCKNTTKYKNVIIFEDDAEYNYKYSTDEFKSIDDFIGDNTFNLYSLGNVSINLPSISDHREILAGFGGSHAIIYSPEGRTKLLNASGNMIDLDLISSIPNKFKHKYPLVCQTFPDTEQKKEWEHLPGMSVMCNITKFLNGDKVIEPFWSSMYLMCDCCVYIVILIVILIIIKCYN